MGSGDFWKTLPCKPKSIFSIHCVAACALSGGKDGLRNIHEGVLEMGCPNIQERIIFKLQKQRQLKQE